MNDLNTNNPLKTILSNTGRHMGDLVTWSVSGKKDRTSIDAILSSLNLTEEIEIPSVSAINCFKRMIRELLATRGLKKQYTLEKVQADKTKIVYAIIAKEIVPMSNTVNDPTLNIDKDVEFETKMHLVFNSDKYYTGATSTDDLLRVTNDQHPLCQRAINLYREFCTTYTTDDIRTGFQRAFTKWNGMKFSAHGGLYWVPSTNAQNVRKWKEFMALTRNQAVIIPMFDSEETIESLRQQTSESLEGQLEMVFSDLEKFTGGDKTRHSTLENRISEFDSILARAELYESLLGHNLDKLKSDIEGAKSGLIASLSTSDTNTEA